MERDFQLLTFLASFSLISQSQCRHCSLMKPSDSLLSFPALTPVSVSFLALSSPHTLRPTVRILCRSGLCAEAQGPCSHFLVPAPISEYPASASHQPPEGAHDRHDDPKQNSSFHKDTSPFQFAYFCSSSCYHSASCLLSFFR